MRKVKDQEQIRDVEGVGQPSGMSNRDEEGEAEEQISQEENAEDI